MPIKRRRTSTFRHFSPRHPCLILHCKFAKRFWSRTQCPSSLSPLIWVVPEGHWKSPQQQCRSRMARGNYMLFCSLTRRGVYTWNMLSIMFATRTSRVNRHDLNLSQRPAETPIMHVVRRASNLSGIPQHERHCWVQFMYSIKNVIHVECIS